jgi:hypothetical protein
MALGFLFVAPAADAASIAPSVRMPDASAGVVEVTYRGRGRRFFLPIAPSYQYYDYPYEYSVGRYPTHIKPGFIYFGRPFSYYSRSYYSKYGSRRYKPRSYR